MTPARKKGLWLALALGLLALAAYLMQDRQPARAASRHAPDEFPHQMRPRSRLATPVARSRSPRATPARRAPPRSDARRLPPGGPDRTALVFETTALKEMPVGRMFLRCMEQNGRSERMEQRLGVGPDQISASPSPTT